MPAETEEAFLPKLHTGALRACFAGKWVLILGDSSMRMLYDHLLMRLASDHHRHWDNMDFHGLPYTHKCQGRDHECYYDAWMHSVRLTFVWHPFASWSAKNLESFLSRSVGIPDILLVGNGPWELQPPFDKHLARPEWRDGGERLLNRIDDILNSIGGELRQLWQSAWVSKPLKIWMNVLASSPDRRYENYIREARSGVDSRQDWVFFDRGRVTLHAQRIVGCEEGQISSESCPNRSHGCGGDIIGALSCELSNFTQKLRPIGDVYHWHPGGEALAVTVDMLGAATCDGSSSRDDDLDLIDKLITPSAETKDKLLELSCGIQRAFGEAEHTGTPHVTGEWAPANLLRPPPVSPRSP